jgi:phosphatidylinositol glycan class A protein
MQLGPFAGPIWTIILIVDCIFFLFLEWWMPREDLDYVNVQWDVEKFTQASLWHFLSRSRTYHLHQTAGQEQGKKHVRLTRWAFR